MSWVAVPLALAVLVVLRAERLLPSRRWRIRNPRLTLAIWGALLAAGGTLFATSLAAAIVQATVGDGIEAAASAVVAWVGLALVGGLLALGISRAEVVAIDRHQDEVELAILSGGTAYRRETFHGLEVAFIEAGECVAALSLAGQRQILVTRAAERALTPLQLRALLEHERAHLSRHHDRWQRLASLNARCFPMLVSSHALLRDVRLLIELVADDDAARRVGSRAAAEALDTVATHQGCAATSLRAARLRTGRLPVVVPAA